MKPAKSLLLILGLGSLASLTGCVGLWRQSTAHQSTSVVQFLYPQQQPFLQPSIPTLRLPLRAGVVFVPPGNNPSAYALPDTRFPEAKKAELLQQIAAQFHQLPFLQSIEIIPSTYLRPGGGFENLDQLRSLFGVDVLVLVSYDQVQSTRDTPWSLAYWTVLGAYVVEAQKNDTHTLMEAAVFDLESHKLLFRAPGISLVHGHSALVTTDDELHRDSFTGFSQATSDLTRNLATELENFKRRIKDAPEEVHIEHRPGYTGAGSFAGTFLIVAGILLLARFGYHCSRR